MLVYLDVLLYQVLAHHIVLLPGSLGRDTGTQGSNTRAGVGVGAEAWIPGVETGRVEKA